MSLTIPRLFSTTFIFPRRLHSTEAAAKPQAQKQKQSKNDRTVQKRPADLIRENFLSEPWWWDWPPRCRCGCGGDVDSCECEPSGLLHRSLVAVKDAGDDYKVVVELPGFKKENVRVELEGDDVVVVSAERQATGGDQKESTTRRVQLPTSTSDASKARAKFEDGVLTVTLPKPPAPATPSKILIPFDSI